jgi:copper(I)-binding protein
MSFFNGRCCGLILSALLLATPAFAHGYKAGTLEIAHPWSRETPPSATTGVGYFKVTNTGTEADRLISAESPNAQKVEMHESSEENGIAKMRRLQVVDIAPGQTVEFKPSGYHLMLIGLKSGLAEGDRIPATFVFEKAGRVDVELTVEAMGAKIDDHGASMPADHKHPTH